MTCDFTSLFTEFQSCQDNGKAVCTRIPLGKNSASLDLNPGPVDQQVNA